MPFPPVDMARGKEIDRGEMDTESSVLRGPLSKQKAQLGKKMLDSLKGN